MESMGNSNSQGRRFNHPARFVQRSQNQSHQCFPFAAVNGDINNNNHYYYSPNNNYSPRPDYSNNCPPPLLPGVAPAPIQQTPLCVYRNQDTYPPVDCYGGVFQPNGVVTYSEKANSEIRKRRERKSSKQQQDEELQPGGQHLQGGAQDQQNGPLDQQNGAHALQNGDFVQINFEELEEDKENLREGQDAPHEDQQLPEAEQILEPWH